MDKIWRYLSQKTPDAVASHNPSHTLRAAYTMVNDTSGHRFTRHIEDKRHSEGGRMQNPVIVCLDLEGVLCSGNLNNFAIKTGIEELKITTREMPDYDALMKRRLHSGSAWFHPG